MIRLLIVFLFFSYNSFGQIKLGFYKEITNTVFIDKAWILSFSSITINKDNSFTYDHRTSEGSLVLYDIKGTWFTKSKKLYLVDSAKCQNSLYDTVTTIRITVFKIQNNRLMYFNSYFDGERVYYSPLRNISGNYIYKQN